MKGCAPTQLSTDSSLPMVSNIEYLVDVDSVAFEWGTLADHANVAGYYIYRKTLADKEYKLIATLDSRFTTHYVDGALTPNTTYLYRFMTKNQQGAASLASEPLKATTHTFSPPQNVQAIGNYPRKIKILWYPHKDLRVQGYVIERADGRDFIEVARVNNRLQVEYLDTNLHDSTEYFYRVIAINANNVRSVASPVVSARTKPVPTPPQGVFASHDLPKMIKITWQPSLRDDVVSYEVLRTILGGISNEVLGSVSADELSFTDKSDIDGVQYGYFVIAIDKDGLRSLPQPSPIVGSTLAAPAAPVVQNIAMENGSVVLRWNSGDSRAVQYTINKQHSSLFGKKERFVSIPYNYFYDHEVVPGERYLYNIIAIDKHGLQSVPSETVSITLEGQ